MIALLLYMRGQIIANLFFGRYPLNQLLAILSPFDISFGAVAQRLEQRTHNPLVVGSNPTCPKFPVFVFLGIGKKT